MPELNQNWPRIVSELCQSCARTVPELHQNYAGCAESVPELRQNWTETTPPRLAKIALTRMSYP